MAQNDDPRRATDMILSPNEHAFIIDQTKGDVSLYTGPNKTSLAGTDQPAIFDERTKKFAPVTLDKAVATNKTAPEGYYIVLKNPAADGKQPAGTGKLSTKELSIGRKIVVPGPASFALWPGQMAKVIPGHHLRSNEYLIARVYDPTAARQNSKNAIIERVLTAPAGDELTEEAKVKAKADKTEKPLDKRDVIDFEKLTMGQLLVIKGTDVAFYIPPTGIEVLTEESTEKFVREAVTLERLEYCLLLDQNGSKRYEFGPAVVFPRPTEKFVEKPIKSDPTRAMAKKFRAVELGKNSGIYVKVIAKYDETVENAYDEKVDGKLVKRAAGDMVTRNVGDELFITGRQKMIYFPMEEHSIIKYGEGEISYAVAIPQGEARYVLDRTLGSIRKEVGPQIFLPDPREEVIVKRALSTEQCQLMYPGNMTALAFNQKLNGEIANSEGGYLESQGYDTSEGPVYAAAAAIATPSMDKRVLIRGASKSVAGDSFDRKNKHTEPRSIVLNTRYDGVVSMSIWTGFAVKLVRANGDTRIVEGPTTAMLDYDEQPQILALSTGNPKSNDRLCKTVYLRRSNNRVSDTIDVETSDLVALRVQVSYLLNFEGDSQKWFDVEDYVKFLCDRMRSKIRNHVRGLGIAEFHAKSESILRNVILGTKVGDAERPGARFEENGMHVYDAEILGVKILNQDVEKLLVNAQRTATEQNISLRTEQTSRDFSLSVEVIKRELSAARAVTEEQTAKLRLEALDRQKDIDLETLNVERDKQALREAMKLQEATAATEVDAQRLIREKSASEAKSAVEREITRNKIELLTADTEAAMRKAEAFSPGLIGALSAFGDKHLIEKVSESVGPMALLGIKDNGVFPALRTLFAGTPLVAAFENLATPAPKAGNGKTSSATSTS